MGTAILFDGVNDQMVYANPPQTLTAYTLLIVAKILVVSDLTWMSFIEQETGIFNRPAIGRRNNSDLYLSDSGAIDSTNAVQVTASDGWLVMCDTKAAGTVVPGFNKVVVGGARTSSAGVGTVSDQAAYPGGTLRIGGNDDFANIEVACAATWAGTVLSAANLDAINAAASSQSILDLNPSWMVDASDGLDVDQTGGGVIRTTVVGTGPGTSDPPGWVYLGSTPIVAATPAPYIRRSRRTTW